MWGKLQSKIIKRILDKKDEIKVIKVLEKTIKEMWLFINLMINNELPGLKAIKYDIKKYKE